MLVATELSYEDIEETSLTIGLAGLSWKTVPPSTPDG